MKQERFYMGHVERRGVSLAVETSEISNGFCLVSQGVGVGKTVEHNWHQMRESPCSFGYL